ncbi:MAG: hypothetical protein LBH44_05795 [Treponema sp.]|jgi:hypothetical protein|nr:hypothetical protein [Treponema sp.]
MDNELNRKPLIVELLRTFLIFFAITILAMSFAGMLVAHFTPDAKDVSALFALGAGLPYSVILQLAGFSFIMAAVSVLLFSERFFTKMRFLWRGFILMFAALLTASFFSLMFKWFPADDLHGWLGFVLCTFICFVISGGITMLKLKLEGKKYDRLLANYKARNRGQRV